MLETERTRLFPLTQDDYPEVLEMFREPDTFRYIEPLDGHDKTWYCNFLDSKRRTIEAGKGYYWVVRLKDTGAYIGSANLYAFRDTPMIQLGCQLKQAYWGQRFAIELMQRVKDYALNDFGLKELFGFFEDDNLASRRILVRLDFQPFQCMEAGGRKIEVYRFASE